MGAPAGDRATREALQWQNGPNPNVKFQKKWEAIIREWSLRWGIGEPRFKVKQIIEWSRQVWKNDGDITWDVPLRPAGTMKSVFLEQLKAVGMASKK